MQPGPEMDALIAEKVIGSHVVRGDCTCFNPSLPPQVHIHVETTPGYIRMEFVPRYSTDIAAAWLVVEHVSVGERRFEMSQRTNGWWAGFFPNPKPTAIGKCVTAATAPLAICLAALKAVGVTID